MLEEYSNEIQDLIIQFLVELKKESNNLSTSARNFIHRKLSEIDSLISVQLNEIIHHSSFQKLESVWRGLHHLVSSSLWEVNLKYLVINLSKKELTRDFERAIEAYQTFFCKKISDLGSPFGGIPIGALIGIYEFGHSPQDISLLQKISEVAQHFYSPFITAVSPQFFGVETFEDITKTDELHAKLKEPEYSYWNSFRNLESSRFVGLCLPRILFRLPYSDKTVSAKSFRFEEDFSDSTKLLYGNPAFAFAERLAHFFQLYRWCAKISSFEDTCFPQIESTELQINAVEDFRFNNIEIALSYFGFIPMINFFSASQFGFRTIQSCEKPKLYETNSATLAARRRSSFPYIFAISRFAHNMVGLLKDCPEMIKTNEDRRNLLQSWIDRYVVQNKPDAQEFNELNKSDSLIDDSERRNSEIAAKYPLQQAFIEIIENHNYSEDSFTVIAEILPYFQLEELPSPLRIVLRHPYF